LEKHPSATKLLRTGFTSANPLKASGLAQAPQQLEFQGPLRLRFFFSKHLNQSVGIIKKQAMRKTVLEQAR